MIRGLLILTVGAAIVWALGGVVLLAFGAILVAVTVAWPVDALCARLPLPRGLALLIVLLALILVITGAFFLMGVQAADDLAQLTKQVPAAMNDLNNTLTAANLPDGVQNQILKVTGNKGLIGEVAAYTSAFFNTLSGLAVTLVAGIYMAASPELYLTGLRKLMPPRMSPRLMECLGASSRALRGWLVGQLIAMAVVGTLTTTGLFILKVPNPLGLGLLAGLLEFVPIAGPILAALPALLISLTMSTHMLFWVLGLYLVVQQIESNILVPLIQEYTVSLPPALGLFALVVFGILFGPIGVLLATPLSIVTIVLVQELYVRDMLGWDITRADEKGDMTEAERG